MTRTRRNLPHPHARGARRAALASAAATLLASAAASAQGTPAEVTPAQTQLNEEAVAATRDGDFDKAIELLRASLRLGEMNITWLNLGRTLARAGRCREAEDAYAHALTSPAVVDPPQSAIRDTIARYRADLKATCPGTLTLTCTPDQMLISIDDGPLQPCPAAPVELPQGDHKLIGVLGEQRTGLSFTIKPLEDAAVRLELTPLPDPDPGKGPPDPGPAQANNPLRTFGWGSIIGGGVLLTSALIVDLFILQPDVGELEDLQTSDDQSAFDDLQEEILETQTLNLVLLSTGAAVSLGGILILLLSDAPPADNTPAVGLDVLVTPNATGLSWTTSW